MDEQQDNIKEYEAILHWMIFLPTIKLCLYLAFFSSLNYFLDLELILQKIQLGSYYEIANQVIFGLFLILIIFSLIKQSITQITTKVYVTSDKLFLRSGFFKVQQMEIPLSQIESTSIYQDFFGKIFNYGTVYFYGTGGRQPAAFWIDKPESLTNVIGRSNE